MQSRPFGSTRLHTTTLGFGGGAIGGLYRAVSRESAFETMEAAWNAGIRYFDTAPFSEAAPRCLSASQSRRASRAMLRSSPSASRLQFGRFSTIWR